MSTRTIIQHSPKFFKTTAEFKVPKRVITRQPVDYAHGIGAIESFTVVSNQRNRKMLTITEACANRIYKPALCVQKEIVVNLNLPW